MPGEIGDARANDLVPNDEATLAVTVLDNTTPAATLTLRSVTAGTLTAGVLNPMTVLLNADKSFQVGRTLPVAGNNPLIAASTLYYHPVNGASTLVVRQGVGGETVTLRAQVFGKLGSA